MTNLRTLAGSSGLVLTFLVLVFAALEPVSVGSTAAVSRIAVVDYAPGLFA